MHYKIRCYNIRWDTDGNSHIFKTLPQEIFYEGYICEEDEDEIDEILGDYLSDNWGFCHYGFEFEVLEKWN
jgi:hypothetical protein